MTTQTELKYYRPKTQLPALVNITEIVLRGYGWMPRDELCKRTGIDKRTIQLVANASGGEIISSNKGYRLLSEATRDEIVHSFRQLRAQAREMIRRSVEQEKKFHQYHGTQDKAA